MTPRFDRRQDEGQGSGSGSGSGAGGSARGGGSGRPARPGKPSFGASRFSGGGGSRSFGPRPEWRAEGPPERGPRPERGSRPERGPRPERSGGSDRPRFDRSGSDRSGSDRSTSERPSGDRPPSGRPAPGRPSSDRPRPDRFRSDRPDRPRFEGARPEGGRSEGPRFEGGRPAGPRPGIARPGRPRLDAPRFDKPRFEGGRPEGRPGARGPAEAGSGDFRPAPRRFDGSGSSGEARPGARRPFSSRPFAGRPDGSSRPDGASRRERPPGAFSPGEPAAEGRFSPSRPEGRRFAGPGASRGSFGRPSFGRPAFGGSGSGRPPFQRAGGQRPPFQSARPDQAVVVDAPTGEAETFGASPADDMIWGRHPALAALESGRPIHRIWCTAEMRFTPKFLQLLREAKSAGVLVEEVTWARLGQLTGGAVHQGITLQAAAAETLDLDSLISGCRDIGEPPLLMAVDGLTDPHNLGAIVRSAEALGAHGLVLPQRRSAGLTGSVAKVAAGALEYLPVARVVNLNRSLETLKQEGYRVVGLAEEGSVTLSEADLDGPLVVVTGSEGSGLSMLTRRHCDQLVRIPLRGATPSLNASVATALLLYEVARRGWMKTITGSAPAPRIVRPKLPTPTRRQAPEPEDDLTGPGGLAAGAGDDMGGVGAALLEPLPEPDALAPELPAPIESPIEFSTESSTESPAESPAEAPAEAPEMAPAGGLEPKGALVAALAEADALPNAPEGVAGPGEGISPPQAAASGNAGASGAVPIATAPIPDAPVAAAEPLVVPDPAAEGQPQALVLGLSPELAGSFEQDILL